VVLCPFLSAESSVNGRKEREIEVLRKWLTSLSLNNSAKRQVMANKANPNDAISLREALKVEIMINQALIDLLVAKGLITQEELLRKIEDIWLEMPKVTS